MNATLYPEARVVIRLSILPLLLGCDPAAEPAAAPAAGWFDEARLDPPFQQVNAIWAGVALLDYDQDGWLDLFFTNGLNHADGLYHNNGDGSFTDVAAAAGVSTITENGAVVAGDLDNDGDPDLVVSAECSTGSWGADGRAELDGGKTVFLNNGDGTFASADIGGDLATLARYCTISMTLADWDGDGALDLLLANGADPDLAPPWIFDKHAEEAVNHIFLNDGSGHFTRDIMVEGTVVSFVQLAYDIDGDARTDLITGQGGREVEVYLQGEDGTPRFDARRSQSGRGLWMGLAAADFDGDDDIDLYATNEGLSPLLAGYDSWSGFYPGNSQQVGDPSATDLDTGVEVDREGINPFHSLLVNTDGHWAPADWPLQSAHTQPGDLFTSLDGRYTQWAQPEGLARFGWAWGVAPLDANADGWPDLMFAPNNCAAPMDIIYTEARGAGAGGLLINDGGHGFIDQTWEAGVADTDEQGRYVDARGVAVGDLNNDGYADVVLVNRTFNPSETSPLAQEVGVPRVFLSRPRDGHFLQVALQGTHSNRDAIGAIVQVQTVDGHWRHLYGAGGQTGSSSERLLTLGLGDATAADLRITFPNGTVVERSGVAADQRITVVEP